MDLIRPVIHLILHAAAPAAVAGIAYRRTFLRAWLIMLATMLVDVDHLLADPVYDPGRCSIGYHPLHEYPVIGLYALLAAWPKTRLVGLGLLLHMLLDGLDCWWMMSEN
jgi:hypothetical protein